jgi:predicted SnoaL-like aldol condensation-catalyzing enzyme
MRKKVNSKSIANTQVDTRSIVNEYFQLVTAGMFRDGLRFFTSDCKTHNPYVRGDMGTLTDAMISASKDMSARTSQPEFLVKHVLVDGNLVAVHTQLLNSKSNPGEGGLRQVHLFRFEGNKIAEYWDITQQIVSSMPNARGAF